MDYDTRIAVRHQVDSATRKRLGLRQAAARRSSVTTPRRHGGWKDGEILIVLQRVAAHEGCSIPEIRLSGYRAFQSANRSSAPSMNTIKARLAAGVPGCPWKLL